MWLVGWKLNGIRNGKVAPHSYVISSPKSIPSHWECIYPDHPGSGFARLRTGSCLFRSTMHRWDMVSIATCECGAEEPTAGHIITVDEETVAWMNKYQHLKSLPEINIFYIRRRRSLFIEFNKSKQSQICQNWFHQILQHKNLFLGSFLHSLEQLKIFLLLFSVLYTRYSKTSGTSDLQRPCVFVIKISTAVVCV